MIAGIVAHRCAVTGEGEDVLTATELVAGKDSSEEVDEKEDVDV